MLWQLLLFIKQIFTNVYKINLKFSKRFSKNLTAVFRNLLYSILKLFLNIYKIKLVLMNDIKKKLLIPK